MNTQNYDNYETVYSECPWDLKSFRTFEKIVLTLNHEGRHQNKIYFKHSAIKSVFVSQYWMLYFSYTLRRGFRESKEVIATHRHEYELNH